MLLESVIERCADDIEIKTKWHNRQSFLYKSRPGAKQGNSIEEVLLSVTTNTILHDLESR